MEQDKNSIEVFIPHKGRFLIDIEDYPLFQKYRWNIYPKRTYKKCLRYLQACVNGKTERFHRLIIKAKTSDIVDHINRNIRDNRKSNLRLVTTRENNLNSSKRINCSSKYKGVSFRTAVGKWRAYIRIGGKFKTLGYFENEKDAFNAICQAKN